MVPESNKELFKLKSCVHFFTYWGVCDGGFDGQVEGEALEGEETLSQRTSFHEDSALRRGP